MATWYLHLTYHTKQANRDKALLTPLFRQQNICPNSLLWIQQSLAFRDTVLEDMRPTMSLHTRNYLLQRARRLVYAFWSINMERQFEAAGISLREGEGS